MRELRQFTRIPFKTEVQLNVNGERFTGESEDLSLYGVFVKISSKLDVNTQVEITIPQLKHPEDENAGISGLVARQTRDGVGIQFNQIGVDAFVSLKKIVTHYTGDETQVMEEFYAYISRKEMSFN